MDAELSVGQVRLFYGSGLFPGRLRKQGAGPLHPTTQRFLLSGGCIAQGEKVNPYREQDLVWQVLFYPP